MGGDEFVEIQRQFHTNLALLGFFNRPDVAALDLTFHRTNTKAMQAVLHFLISRLYPAQANEVYSIPTRTYARTHETYTRRSICCSSTSETQSMVVTFNDNAMIHRWIMALVPALWYANPLDTVVPERMACSRYETSARVHHSCRRCAQGLGEGWHHTAASRAPINHPNLLGREVRIDEAR